MRGLFASDSWRNLLCFFKLSAPFHRHGVRCTHRHVLQNRGFWALGAASLSGLNEIARRYASALFELAQDKGALEDTYKGTRILSEAISQSDDLQAFLSAPLYKLEDKTSALTALAEKLALPGLLVKFVGTMARNGRARDLGGAMAAFDQLYASQRGIKRAIATTARPMTDDQRGRLEALLAKAVGGNVELKEEVDEGLIGGVQLKIGSQLVDASLRAKLERLNSAMKGA